MNIEEKIKNKTVTVDDFDLLIEASRKAAVERVLRRTRVSPTDSHIDNDGHQKLSLPDFKSRITPKLEPSGNNQMKHRGKSAHKRSTKKQQRQSNV